MVDKILPEKENYGRPLDHYEDNDFIDRLNSRWTVRVLVMCIFVISGNMLWVKHINCWTPNEFALPHIEYANSICWLKGSYYLPTNEITIPDRSKPRTHFISYYQWTPFILLGMALLFLLPRFLWHACPRQGGVNIRRLVRGIKDNTDEDKGIKAAQVALKLYLDAQYDQRQTVCCTCPYPKCYYGYTSAYLSIKMLYVINAFSQFILLNNFLSFEFTSYGIEALIKMYKGEDWFESPTFPRVTMCDFMVRRLGSNQHWYSVQCNLPFNMYNEKIFLGIWFWLIILTILNIFSIISWLISLNPLRQLAAISRHLAISKTLPKEKESQKFNKEEDTSLVATEKQGRAIDPDGAKNFLKYLKMDGYLFFRLIERNTDEIAAAKIIKYLYNNQPPRRSMVGSDV